MIGWILPKNELFLESIAPVYGYPPARVEYSTEESIVSRATGTPVLGAVGDPVLDPVLCRVGPILDDWYILHPRVGCNYI
jgi:hypothetical protein